MTALIGLDWGTTNARAMRFAADGSVAEIRERPLGILRVPGGNFPAAFAELAGDWRAEAPAAPVFIDGQKALTLRGEGIAREFQTIVDNYIEKRFGAAA